MNSDSVRCQEVMPLLIHYCIQKILQVLSQRKLPDLKSILTKVLYPASNYCLHAKLLHMPLLGEKLIRVSLYRQKNKELRYLLLVLLCRGGLGEEVIATYLAAEPAELWKSCKTALSVSSVSCKSLNRNCLHKSCQPILLWSHTVPCVCTQ